MSSSALHSQRPAGIYGKHKRPLSPYTGMERGRVLSNNSHASYWSTSTVSPIASSPEGNSPGSPGGGITDGVSSLNFDPSAGQPYTRDVQYSTEPTGDPYQPHYSQQAPADGASAQENSWYQYYDFIVNVEHGQDPYWQLKAEYSPSAEYPRVVAVENTGGQTASPVTPRPDQTKGHVCLRGGCESKPFKRKADLERHYQQVHLDSRDKPSYPCDYGRCPRSTDHFYRRDHCRDHYREYHKEDLCKRSGGSGPGSPFSSSSSARRRLETEDWWAGRSGINKKWWRCSKCLRRVSIQDEHFECRDCRTPCEAERRRRRGYN